jgi:hypothetical protein
MDEHEPPPTGKPLFSCGYADFAWRKVAYGHFLDDWGQVWFYDLGDTWSPEPAGNGLYLEMGLRSRFAGAVLEQRVVPATRVAELRQLARAASTGRIEQRHVAFDAGSGSCEAYVWETGDAYQSVKLGGDGGVRVRNSNAAAAQLVAALTSEIFKGLPRRW